jgi:hypothetical protein
LTLFLIPGNYFLNLSPPPSPTFLGKMVARNKNLLQGMTDFGRRILADTPELKGASFAPGYNNSEIQQFF